MMKKKILIRLFMYIMLIILSAHMFPSALAYESTTLCNGSRGEEVRQLQQALIDLKYLKGTADGVFGNKTENAVRAFQKKNKLSVDGLAGTKTRELILRLAEQIYAPQVISAPEPEAASKVPDTSDKSSASSSGKLFGGNYTAIRYGNRGERVKALQKALILLGTLSGKADGIFGKKTLAAVMKFQKSKKLTSDGVAGKKTLTALEKAYTGASSSELNSPSAAQPTPVPSPSSETGLNERISAPKASKLKLLHWFKDVKPSLSNGQKLLIYDPSSGLSWTVKILARGRHCDAEPLTAKDTKTMVTAFGGTNTWNQKAVYVKLPDGRWTIGSTHDMPHQSGSIKDNGFNGHLCVHFLRDMDEAKKNDPSYGVANQETIRKYWKQWTGEEISI